LVAAEQFIGGCLTSCAYRDKVVVRTFFVRRFTV
jgi:hypothetical protein